MLEESMIRHCSPTLAGIKTANMFTYKFQSIGTLQRELQEENRKLNEKGVFVELLRINDTKALVYAYRKRMLEEDLNREGAKELLAEYGYQGLGTAEYLDKLKTRLSGCECFPHEVGLFLGYPLPDVRGFIEQKGQNYKCRGIWKVYGDEYETKKIFEKLKKCAEVYNRLFADGRSITQLTVAA